MRLHCSKCQIAICLSPVQKLIALVTIRARRWCSSLTADERICYCDATSVTYAVCCKPADKWSDGNFVFNASRGIWIDASLNQAALFIISPSAGVCHICDFIYVLSHPCMRPAPTSDLKLTLALGASEKKTQLPNNELQIQNHVALLKLFVVLVYVAWFFSTGQRPVFFASAPFHMSIRRLLVAPYIIIGRAKIYVYARSPGETIKSIYLCSAQNAKCSLSSSSCN